MEVVIVAVLRSFGLFIVDLRKASILSRGLAGSDAVGTAQ